MGRYGSIRERDVPVTPKQLIRDVYKRLLRTDNGLVAVAISDVYMKLPYSAIKSKGQTVTKQRYVPIAAIVAMPLKEDEENPELQSDTMDNSCINNRLQKNPINRNISHEFTSIIKIDKLGGIFI